MPEPEFVPKPGQTDFRNMRYAPCINVVVVKDGKILLAKRAEGRRLYPGYWSTIDGFLDDNKSVEEKAYEELREEVSILPKDVVELKRGQVVVMEAPDYKKTWLFIPVLAMVKTEKFKLDWEASEAKWFAPQEVTDLNLSPGVIAVLSQFFPEI